MVCPDLLFGLVQDTEILGWEMLMLPASLTVMDCVSVLDIFTDQARIPQCGTVFLPEQPIVIIPKPKKSSRSREEVEPVIIIQTENVSQVEHFCTENYIVVCLHLNIGLNHKILNTKNRIFFIMEDHQAKIFNFGAYWCGST